MDPEELLELIKSRRSIRKWKKQPVEPEKIGKILQAGLYAPSGANCQKTRLYMINDPRQIRAVSDNAGPLFVRDQPAVIILVLFDLQKPNPARLNHLAPHPAWSKLIWQDTACAMMNMLLMTEALGLSACWISILPPQLGPAQNNLRNLLHIHSRYILTCMLFIGYGNEKVDINKDLHAGLPIRRNPAECFLETVEK